LFAPLTAAFRKLRRQRKLLDMPIAPDDDIRDTETVRRAAAILEAYVRQPAQLAGPHKMSAAEALDVLGLQPGADEAAIRAAHRRLMRLVHPEHTGSTWLAAKVTEAKDTLLPGSEERLLPFRQSSGN
jgi:putative SOS response-associated peptidase YedK